MQHDNDPEHTGDTTKHFVKQKVLNVSWKSAWMEQLFITNYLKKVKTTISD